MDWTEFFSASENKKLVLFGITDYTEHFFDIRQKNAEVHAVLDNDVKKQGCALGELCAANMTEEEADIKIQSLEALLDMTRADEICVLVCNKRYYKEIFEQLSNRGINNYYAAHLLDGTAVDSERKCRYLSEYVNNNPIQNNKCVIYVEKYGGHGIYISHKLHEYLPELDIVWIVTDFKMPVAEYVRKVSATNWRKALEEAATARVLIYDNKVLSTLYKKRKGQLFIQTKHWSSITLKKFWLDDNVAMFPEVLNKVKTLSDDTDVCFVGSSFDEASMRSGFGYKGECVRVGSCRSDILFDDEAIKKLKNKYGLDTSIRYILYAPTVRRKIDNGIAKLVLQDTLPDFEMLRAGFEKSFGGKWKVILRLHPGLSYMAGNLAKKYDVIDMTDIQDGQEIVAVSDAMITDYSSIMFETAFTHKPVFLFAPDLDSFLLGERGFLLEYNELPFSAAVNMEEIMTQIETFNQKTYEESLETFFKMYDIKEDGKASERAAKYIISRCEF